MKEYRVKVVEKHSDHVWVKAESRAKALEEAMDKANCEFECVYDCQIVEEREI